jgi:hypothetical protein
VIGEDIVYFMFLWHFILCFCDKNLNKLDFDIEENKPCTPKTESPLKIIFLMFKKKRTICLENSSAYYNFAKTLVGKQDGNSTFLSRWDARL